MNVIQIVPGLPPQVDGIGDYALQLARQLRERHGIETAFIVCDADWTGGPLEGFHAVKIAGHSEQALFESIAACRASFGAGVESRILVQFAPYGYEKRGCPVWLAGALESWNKREPGTLNIVFHELEVTGLPPWKSGFWLSGLQKSVCTRIAKVGSFMYTNTELSRGKLENWGSGRMNLIPNFSTLGEPRVCPPFAGRGRNIVVFGRAAQRAWTYERGSEALVGVCKRIGAKRIIDIGSPIEGDTRTEIGGVPLVRCGRLETEAVNEWMATSLATFSYYPVPFLGKSSIHAVSCAHGTVAFVFDNQEKPHSCPGMIPGEDYIPVPWGGVEPELPPFEELSETVFRNYQARASWTAADKVKLGLMG